MKIRKKDKSFLLRFEEVVLIEMDSSSAYIDISAPPLNANNSTIPSTVNVSFSNPASPNSSTIRATAMDAEPETTSTTGLTAAKKTWKTQQIPDKIKAVYTINYNTALTQLNKKGNISKLRKGNYCSILFVAFGNYCCLR